MVDIGGEYNFERLVQLFKKDSGPWAYWRVMSIYNNNNETGYFLNTI